MFSFTSDQKIIELNDFKIGGLPGENPTLMMGSLFYKDEFETPKESLDEASQLIQKQRDLADKTALNPMADILIHEKDEVEWKIDFALDNISGMFSLDIPEAEVRIKALEYLKELNALDRVLYNSLNLGLTDEELEVLQENPPEAAIGLAYNPQDHGVQGRLDVIENGGDLLSKGILKRAKEIDTKVLLDTAATPFGEGACETLRAIPVFKSEIGLPVGCSLHNTVQSWLWLKEYEDREDVEPVLDTAVDGLPVTLGADFIYYGPIENAKNEFPTIAMVDKLIAEGAEEYFGTEVNEEHPYNLLK